MIIMITVSLSMAFLYFYMPTYYREKQEKEANVVVEKLSKKFTNKAIDDVIADLEQLSSYENPFNNFTLFNKKEEIIFQSNSLSVLAGQTISSAEVNPVVAVERLELNRLSIKRTFLDKNGDEFTLLLYLFQDEIDNASAVLLDLFPFILLIALLVGSIAAFLYSKSSTKRIRNLSKTTNHMLRIDSSYQCDVTGNDEITELAADINQLNKTLVTTIIDLEQEVKKVEEAEAYRSYFFQSAAHELKTPVTIMNGVIEGMILNFGRYKDRDKYLIVCQELLENQTDLINKLFDIYQLDNSDLNTKELSTFSLDELIYEQVASHELLAKANNNQFQVQLTNCYLNADQHSVRLIISNVISNACYYSTKGTTIKITLDNGGLKIENECAPLSEKELTNIFKPFYRPDFSRNKKDGGTGLGLYIVKNILEEENYSYSFYPTENSMIFEIDFVINSSNN